MQRIETLEAAIRLLYEEEGRHLLFHGLHHILFVRKKAVEFSRLIEANVEIVEAAALTHDLNYLIDPASEPELARDWRAELLKNAGFDSQEIRMIEHTISSAHMKTRSLAVGGRAPSLETRALSDADTLFKALPITPIIFAGRYIEETGTDMAKLARKVVAEQQPLMDADAYFYIEEVRKTYFHWASANLQLWRNVSEALDDPDVADLLANRLIFTD